MSQDLREIRESLRLEELLEDLGIPIVASTPTGWQDTPCPLPTHPGQDKSPSFGIHEEHLAFNCFTCDEHGSIIKLAAILRDISYEEALDYVLSFTDLDQLELDDGGESFIEQIRKILAKEKEQPRRSRRVVLPYFDPGALDDLPLAPVRYLRKWGICDPYTVRVFKLRYNAQCERGTYAGPALLIPHIISGQLVGWQQRWLDAERPDWIAKYTNTSDFPRLETLYNQDRALNLGDPVIVVESVMTVVRLFELGYTAVATFGASVREEQLQILRRLSQVVLAFDNDTTGRKALRKLGDDLSDFTDVYVVPQPPGAKSDLADVPAEEVHRLIDGARHYLELGF